MFKFKCFLGNIDKGYELIRRFETTTALVHDSQVDLSEMNEVVYRDKGYFGVVARGFDQHLLC